MKRITKKWLKEKRACQEGIDWFCTLNTTSLIKVLEAARDQNQWQYVTWLMRHTLNKKQSVTLAIFAAESVLHIFEKKHPNDGRPRKAIEAAKAYLKNPSAKTKKAANYAASAAYAAYAANAADYFAANFAADYFTVNAADYFAANFAADYFANAADYFAANAADYFAADYFAANSANSAAYSANSAANAADYFAAAVKKKVVDKMIDLLKESEVE